jgi:CAAX protease family protein
MDSTWVMASSPVHRRVETTTYAGYALLMLAWIAAWLIKLRLDARVPWLATDAGGVVFWTLAKLLIWIAPAVWLIHASGRGVGEVLNVRCWRAAVAWGGGIGLAIALTGFVPKWLQGRPLLPATFSSPLVNSFIVAPLFEEFLMRGAILGNLEQARSFWTANVLSALMFVGLHLPGWYFAGVLRAQLTRPVGGALSIFVLGLAFGYAVRRSRSVLAGSLAHVLNNLASS